MLGVDPELVVVAEPCRETSVENDTAVYYCETECFI
jgi:hypothetical protein